MTTLTDYIKSSTGFAESTIAAVTSSTIAFLANSLRNGESVKLEGLGTLKVIDKPERQGRNPRTGQPTVFKASRRTKLAFSKPFINSIQPDALAEADIKPSGVIENNPSLLENPEALPEMPSAISADLLPQSPVAPPPIPAELLTESKAQLELMWQIKAPDNSFVEVPSADLTNWGVTANTPIYSVATGWLLAGKVPELAGIVV